MSAILYDHALQHFSAGDIHILTDAITVYLIDTSLYTFSQSSHEFLTSIPSGARIASTTIPTTGRTNVAGVFDGADVTFTSVAAGHTGGALVIADTQGGTDATSYLLAYEDSGVVGLPVTTNGGNIDVAWDNGANKIFAI